MAPEGPSVLHVFEPADGGVPEHVAALSEGLIERGYRVLAAGRPDASARPRLEAAGVAYAPVDLVGSLPAPARDAAGLRALRRLIARERPDVVHTHAQKAGLLGRLAARSAGVPALYTALSLVYATQPQMARRGGALRHRGGRAFERALGRRSAALIAVAENERRVMLADRLAPPERIHVIHNGVRYDGGAPDPELMRFRGDGPLFGLVAGLREQKGLPTLLAALAELARRGAAPRFAIVGNGPLRDEVARRLEADGLGPTTRVLPFGGAVVPYLEALDAFVLPSYWEGLPLAVLEAMHAGLPVIASAAGGVPEAVSDGDTGFVVAVRDAAALADRIERLAADAALRERMGEAGRRRAQERFGVEGMVERTDAVYRSVLAGC